MQPCRSDNDCERYGKTNVAHGSSLPGFVPLNITTE
jgi:hypothetical protein